MGVDLWRVLVISDGFFFFLQMILKAGELWIKTFKPFLLHVKIVRLPNLLLGSRI